MVAVPAVVAPAPLSQNKPAPVSQNKPAAVVVKPIMATLPPRPRTAANAVGRTVPPPFVPPSPAKVGPAAVAQPNSPESR